MEIFHPCSRVEMYHAKDLEGCGYLLKGVTLPLNEVS